MGMIKWVRGLLRYDICSKCKMTIWIWQNAEIMTYPDESYDIKHSHCSHEYHPSILGDLIIQRMAERRGSLTLAGMSDIERIIREEFDNFDDMYLRDDANWMMRQRTNRLCEDIVECVLKEVDVVR